MTFTRQTAVILRYIHFQLIDEKENTSSGIKIMTGHNASPVEQGTTFRSLALKVR